MVSPDLPKFVYYTGAPMACGCEEGRLATVHRGAAAKFDALAASPFETTLFLDNDTIVLRDPSRLLRETGYVAALPYPDFFAALVLPRPMSSSLELPEQWRNVNSGVVVFRRAFLAHYAEVWARHGRWAGVLPGFDQCLFSLALATAPRPWTPRLDLQVTTTPYALSYLRALRGIPTGSVVAALGEIPYTLLLTVHILHYTAEKARYEALLDRDAVVDQLCTNPIVSQSQLDPASVPRIMVDPRAVPASEPTPPVGRPSFRPAARQDPTLP